MKYWTHPWNPIIGCQKCSPGCQNCYALSMAQRLCALGNAKYRDAIKYTGSSFRWTTAWTGEVSLDQAALEAPLYAQKPRVYFNSMCDPFYCAVPGEWIDSLFRIAALAARHTYVLCTKRAERIYTHLRDLTTPVANIYLGITVENQAMADERLPWLAKLAAAGWKTWVSYEPALEPVLWDQYYRAETILGVIAGGETGPFARPANPDWFGQCRDTCADGGIAFCLKQLGPKRDRVLDGRTHDELPWRMT